MIILSVFLWHQFPIIGDEFNKQTLYVSILDMWHGASTDSKAHAMWIDDDSSEGVFKVKKIADEIGIKPVFAVIAEKMTPDISDSLVTWQQQGTGIVIHGLRHESWKDWDETQITHEIQQCYEKLDDLGFDTTKILKIIIPPHGPNTCTIRKVIKQQGCRMVSGARLVNPDRHVFQYGRIGITADTDVEKMRQLLAKAYQRKAFVIFGTHSSIPDIFSEEKTREVLRIAKEIGFNFEYE
jgi:hypothetical protein